MDEYFGARAKPVHGGMNVMCRCSGFTLTKHYVAVKITDDQVRCGDFRKMQSKWIDQEMLAVG